jgi:pimeloyl-ACP methyl ester carboxylesterase
MAGNAVNFPIAAWQLYFVVGLAMGHHREAIRARLSAVPAWPAFAAATITFLALIVLDAGHESGRIATWPVLQVIDAETYHRVFAKSSVAWGRVGAFAIAACFFFLGVSLFWRPVRRISGWLFLPLGQHALLAYGLHLLVIVAIYNLDRWELYDRSRFSNTVLQAATVGLVWILVKQWAQLESLPARVQAMLEAPLGSARQRLGLIVTSGLFAVLAIWTASAVGPIRSTRPAGTDADSAGTLVYVPPQTTTPGGPKILLILRPSTETGPAAARSLLAEAERSGWLIIAPTADYGGWSSEDEVRGAARRLFPSLRDLVTDRAATGDTVSEPRVFVYGVGRGGQLAHLFALAYPELVRAVASVAAIPCTLPVEETQTAGIRVPLVFPRGVGDMAAYRGQPENFDALGRVDFWIQPQSTPAGPLPQGCMWLDAGVNDADRLSEYVTGLRDTGARVELVVGGNEAGPPFRRALRFFEELPSP